MVLILALVALAFCIFFLLRNNYVFNREIEAGMAVFRYSMNLFLTSQYNSDINYHHEMEIKYDTLLFDIARWGKYAAVKDEYIETLKPYFD